MLSHLITRVVMAALCVFALDARLTRCDEAEENAPNKAASTPEARQTIERGLTFLEKDALVWRKEHQCATCHHGTMTVWALSEAKSRGYAVKPETLADVTAWTMERLKGIDKPRDTRPGWKMVNTPALYLAIMAQAVPKQEAVSAEELRRIGGHLVRHQEADGSWAWSSAPPGNRPPPHFESDEVATLLGYMALGPQVPVDPKKPSQARDSRAKAAAWLGKCEPTDTTQAAGLRLLVKVRAGESTEALRPEIDRFLGRQNEDGGWGQLRDLHSDAYATGQALYVLGQAGVPSERTGVRRGVDFLVASQRRDGSWPMKSRAHPGAKPYTNPVPITYFGSAWAMLGLMRSVPPPVEAAATRSRPGERFLPLDVVSRLLGSRSDRPFPFLSGMSPVNRHVVTLLALGVGLPLAAAAAQTTPATPAEQYRAILKETQALYDAAQKRFAASAPKGGTPSDEQRTAFVGRAYGIKYEQAPKLVALAEKYPHDPIALDALTQAVWQVNTVPYPVEMVGRDEARPRAFAILRRDHIRSERIGPLCERISGGLCAEYEPFLREVLEQNPRKEVRAQACLALAHFLSNRSLKLELVLGDRKLAREFADLYGEDYLGGLRRQDRARAAAEAEALLVRATRDYGDVKLPDGETVAEKAEPELFGLRHLSVGKVAPDIEGLDQNGVRFKLSDYRGKVVLLDFWSEY